uniref:Uncharacterized protein n=1 Tax=Candidatus Nitrotoga fabula TaxID=2182327 RepID=A0A2X0SLE9_9PROT|nr:protein of unknown function [Candidatus Nitrotoga fabula]
MPAPLLVAFLHSIADNRLVAIVVTPNRGKFVTTEVTTIRVWTQQDVTTLHRTI